MRYFTTLGVFAVSLSLVAKAAVAAPTPANPIPPASHARLARAPAYQAPHSAARAYAPRTRLGLDIGQFVAGMLGGGPVPYANIVRDVRRMPASRGTYDYSPPVDYPSDAAPVGCASCDAQAASDQEVQLIQQMNDISAMNATIAAAAAQNAADTAATIQTEINAGM